MLVVLVVVLLAVFVLGVAAVVVGVVDMCVLLKSWPQSRLTRQPR